MINFQTGLAKTLNLAVNLAALPFRMCHWRLIRFFPIAVLLALWANPNSAQAQASAVVTFTNIPSVVSNTYNGVITLQINGLTNGVTNVVVQKFLDVNTNGVIDAGDILVQQFQLGVGQASIFTNGGTQITVTNFFPGDMTLGTTGQITATFNFQNGDFAQNIVGQYIYRISSPSASEQFPAVTQLFEVTNTFFSSLVTGTVQNADSPGVVIATNALVLLCVVQNGGLNVQAGAVANDSGSFSIRAPPNMGGYQYFLLAARSNWVENASNEPEFTLYPNQTNVETVSLTPATTNVVGRVVDFSSSAGLPGMDGLLVSTDNFVSLYFTDTNGNFTAPVTADNWAAPVNGFAAAFHNYLAWQGYPLFTVTNKLVAITNPLPAATAIFYGTVTNTSVAPAVPMPGVYVTAADNAGHLASAMTDQHGQYVIGVLAGTNQWELAIQANNNPGLNLTNTWVVSPGYVQTNLIATNQAILQNFSIDSAGYTIDGGVFDVEGNPISGVEVDAGGVITGATVANYQAFSTTTASDGSYTLHVSPGIWTVSVNTNSLAELGYTNFPAAQLVTNSGVNISGVNFYVLICGEIEIITTNLPNAMVGSPYSTTLQASACGNITNWSTAYGITLTSLYDGTNINYPAGTVIYSDSNLVGYLETYFTFGFYQGPGDQPVYYFTNISGSAGPYSGGGRTVAFTGLSATVNVSAPFTNKLSIPINGINWTAQPTTQNGSTYSTVLTNAEVLQGLGNGSYNYTANVGSLMTTSGNPSNTVAVLGGAFQSQPTVGNSINLPSTNSYNGSNNVVVWLQSGTNTPGQYSISAYGPQSTNLPPGLALFPDGTISGTPTNSGLYDFTVSVSDTASNASVEPLSILVYPATTITAPSSSAVNGLLSSNTFQIQVNGILSNQNYTVQMSTNLATTNWVTILTTNAASTNSLLVADPNATNPAQFYRVLLGP